MELPMRRALFAAAILLSTLAGAETPPPAPGGALPAVLNDWRGWVLKDQEFRSCPFLITQTPGEAEHHLCAWPGRLHIDAGADGARFAQGWRVEVRDWVPLPGDAQHWPQAVKVDGQPAPVLLHADGPALWLEAGTHEISGSLPWTQRPQQLRVPERIGLVELRVDGKPVLPLEREGEALTLGRGSVEAPEQDALSLKVFRALTDGVPATLETRLELEVAGQAREETLGPVLPAGFEPTRLDGELPARLDRDGLLHVQVQPGSWNVTLAARYTEPLAKIAAHVPAAPWPNQEIWSYAAAPGLRVTSASGATPIDPAQVGVPDAWRALPAFALADGETLDIEERSRGLDMQNANRLTLQREAWLDFAGAGLYAKDRIQGRMTRDWRLDVVAPYVLERAEANGEGLLVTTAAGASGVEVRNPAVDVAAGVRIDRAAGELPVTGWQQGFDSVGLHLHLPFGYRLLAAPGADRADGSWF